MALVPYVAEGMELIEGLGEAGQEVGVNSRIAQLTEAAYQAQVLRGLAREFGGDIKWVYNKLGEFNDLQGKGIKSLRARLKRLRGRSRGPAKSKKKQKMARSGGKSGSSVIVKRGGVSKARVKTARSKPRKKRVSKLKKLEKRVKKLSVTQPPKNVAFYQNGTFIKLVGSSETAGGKFFEIVMCEKSLLDNPLNDLPFGITDTDFTSVNSELLIRNYFSELELVNAVTANMHLEYMFVKSKGEPTDHYLNALDRYLDDRGDGLANTVVAATAATATTSVVPTRITLKPHEIFVPITGGFLEPTCEYKQVGKVHKMTLGPGDHHRMKWSAKNMIYKQEKVNGGTTYTSNYTVHLVVKIYGDLAHDVTNTGFVTRMDPSADCFRRQQFEVVYFGGSGIKTIERETTMDTNQDTAVSQAVQADNYQSGVFHADD